MGNSKNIKINSKNVFIGIAVLLELLFFGLLFISDQGTQANTNLDNNLIPGETNSVLTMVNGEGIK